MDLIFALRHCLTLKCLLNYQLNLYQKMEHLFLSTFCTVEAIECHLKPDSILTLSAIDYLRPEGFTQLRCQLYHLELCSVLPTVFSCLLFALFCITLPSVLLSLSSCSCVRCLVSRVHRRANRCHLRVPLYIISRKL